MTTITGTAAVLDEIEVLRLSESDADTTVEAGLGALRTERGNLPLESIAVRSTVTGLAVRTELTQGFQNPYATPIEATYVFPLPDRAAVIALRMEADDRVIEGILKERGQARADYDQALSEGKRVSIAEEERPGVFTMRVGNIMPGERVVVRLTLSGRLPYEDGEATYRFPLVVAPRYLPGSVLGGDQVGSGVEPDTDRVPDASRISPPVLLPGFPNPVRLSVRVDIDPAGLGLSAVRSSLHGVTVDAPDDCAPDDSGPEGSQDRVIVRLHPGDRANRDFILRLRFGSPDAVCTALAVRPDAVGAEGTFMLTLLPPTAGATTTRPRDVVLVLDRSGSMDGWKMVAARRAAARIVDTLTSRDRFAVLAFDSVVECAPELGDGLVDATDRNRFRAVEHLAKLEARGGTELWEPLRQATDLLSGTAADVAGSTDGVAAGLAVEPRDRVLVLVTDGQVGDEDQILAELAPRLSVGIRVHTLGIDRAVNEAFLRRLADLNGGRYELVESEDRLDEAMEQIHRRIGSPLVTRPRLTVAGLAVDVASIVPARLPDLFAGAPLVITGRYAGQPVGTARVVGELTDGTPWSVGVGVVQVGDASLGSIWARGRIRDLEDRYVVGDGDHDGLEREIVATSLAFSVLCRFTAFVAVDARVVNEGGAMRPMTQPVDVPDGWGMFQSRGLGGQLPGGFAGPPSPSVSMPSPRRAAMPMAVSAAAPVRVDGTERDDLLFEVAAESSVQVARSGRPAVPTKERKRSAGPVPVIVPVDARAEASAMLAELRLAASRPADERRGLLLSLLEKLTRLAAADRSGSTGVELSALIGDITRIRDLSPTGGISSIGDSTQIEQQGLPDLEACWSRTIEILTAVVGEPEPRSLRPFWKR